MKPVFKPISKLPAPIRSAENGTGYVFHQKNSNSPAGPIEHADELKVVIYHPSDFKWAESFAEKVKPGCKLFLQPEWSKRETIIPLISDYIMKNPKWEFSLQLHKYIQVP